MKNIYILYLALVINPICSHSQDLTALDVKNGFKDAKFGMLLSQFKGMKLIYSRPSSSSKGYIRISDKKTIGDIPLTGITYYFFNNKLSSIHVRANMKYKADIIQTLENSYGSGKLTNHNTSPNGFLGYWQSQNVILQVSEYFVNSKEIIAEFYSVPIMEEEHKYEFAKSQQQAELKAKKRKAAL